MPPDGWATIGRSGVIRTGSGRRGGGQTAH